jgi:glutamine amidotransferase
MRVAIIDYEAGNLTSVARAVAAVGHEGVVTRDAAVIAAADKVIFPGVGAAGSCMASFRALGMDQALAQVIAADRPLLCICVGLQLLFESSEEDGGTPCLGILPGRVVRFQPTDPALKVPHMGWNPTTLEDPQLGRGIAADAAFYYVHSYHPAPGAGVQVIATADHGGRFCAGVRRGNLAAVQFHPEKSGAVGLRLLSNFLSA